MFVRFATSPRRSGSSNFQLFYDLRPTVGSSQVYFMEIHPAITNNRITLCRY